MSERHIKVSETATASDWLAAFRQIEAAYSRNKSRKWVLQMLAERVNSQADPGIPIHPTSLASTGIKGVAYIPEEGE